MNKKSKTKKKKKQLSDAVEPPRRDRAASKRKRSKKKKKYPGSSCGWKGLDMTRLSIAVFTIYFVLFVLYADMYLHGEWIVCIACMRAGNVK